MQSCYERAIRLTIHLLGASNDDLGAYDGVNFSPKSVTPRQFRTGGPKLLDSTGGHAFGPKKKYFVPKILMKQPHDCSY